jgi:tetratricopeptide (TPR) repeat protein
MPYTPLQLAEVFIQTGELTDALDALNQHLEANPADDDSRRLRTQVLMRLRRPEDVSLALADLRRLETPSVQDRLTLAILLEQSGDFPMAVETLAKLHADYPHDEPIAERYFVVLMREGLHTTAAELLKTRPHTFGWLTKAGDLALESGHMEEAIQHYTEAVQKLGVAFDLETSEFARPIHANILTSRAQAYTNLKRFHEASEDDAAAQAIMPEDPLIGFWHGVVLAELGNVEEALFACHLALQTPNPTLRTQMIDHLKSLGSNPTFAPLVALLN